MAEHGTNDMNQTSDSSDKYEELNRRMRKYTLRLGATVEAILADIPDTRLRRLVAELAFAPSQALPKRALRPNFKLAYITEQFYDALLDRADAAEAPEVPDAREAAEAPDDRRENLRRLVLTFHEGADMVDDLVDGDVRRGDELPVGLVVCTLANLSYRYAARLGERAYRVYCQRQLDLPAAVLVEKQTPATLERYLRSVDLQAALIIAPLEAAAVLSGQAAGGLPLAVRLGRSLYRYKQFSTDMFQQDPDRNLNLNQFCTPEELVERLQAEHAALQQIISELPAGKGRDSLKLLFDVYVLSTPAREESASKSG
jgi:hypothetical protein